MRALTLFAACSFALAGSPPPESAAGIMAKVARNQERAHELRSAFVYQQSVLIHLQRGNHKLAREELSQFTVTPTAKGVNKTLAHFAGKYESKGELVDYHQPHYNYKDVDIDGDLISDLAEDLTNDQGARDGIAADLFPLTGERQKGYAFKLEDRQAYRGKEVYRITFKPLSNKHWDDGTPWAGEVLVDAREYQPVVITTRLARGIPFWIKTVLGTNVKYIGFKLTYERFEDGVWFPVTYGGEFELRAVFFYKRLISMALTNTGFQRADVNSRISYEMPK